MRSHTKSNNDLRTVDPIHAHPHSANDYPAPCPLCVPSASTSTTASDDDDDDDDSSPTTPAPSELSADLNERPGRVRFRDRVRITSGLKTHRGSRSDPAAEYIPIALSRPRRSPSPSPSPSSSRSSSISVPLRSEIDDADAKPGWGTLGQRVSLMAQHHAERKMQRDQRYRELLAKHYQLGLRLPRGRGGEYGTERSPLMNPDAFLKLYMSRDGAPHDSRNLTPSEREQYRERKIDQAFGPWPHRLWNHHWWWWHIEPVICCHYCVEEFDDEHS